MSTAMRPLTRPPPGLTKYGYSCEGTDRGIWPIQNNRPAYPVMETTQILAHREIKLYIQKRVIIIAARDPLQHRDNPHQVNNVRRYQENKIERECTLFTNFNAYMQI